MYVDREEFLSTFKAYWSSPTGTGLHPNTEEGEGLGNALSQNLIHIWGMLHYAYEEALADGDKDKWRCMGPHTGSGKTESAYCYLGLLAHNLLNSTEERKPGAVMICRTRAQCDEAVDRINIWAGSDDAAVTHHSGDKDTYRDPVYLRRTQDHPILIITHSAFERAMMVTQDRTIENLWDTFGHWKDASGVKHERALSIIDEALQNTVDHLDFNGESDFLYLKAVCADAPTLMQDHQDALGIINKMEGTFLIAQIHSDVRKDQTGERGKRFLRQHLVQTFGSPKECDEAAVIIASFREAFEGYWKGKRAPRPNVNRGGKSVRKNLRETAVEMGKTLLKTLETVLLQQSYYHRLGLRNTFSTANYLLPSELKGIVMLDATSRQNTLVKLLGEDKVIRPIMPKARDYSSVTLHVARTKQGVGKTKSNAEAAPRATKIASFIQKNSKLDDKWLVICPKGARPEYEKKLQDFPFFEGDVAHWGDVSGRNDWNDYQNVIITSLPYRPPHHATNLVLLFWGFIDGENYSESDVIKDWREGMERGVLIADVVQAVNRIRCRRVIDTQGRCSPANIYLMLPENETGEYVLDQLKLEMDGIKVKDWAFDFDRSQKKTGPRKPKSASAKDDQMILATIRNLGTQANTIQLDQLTHACGLKYDRKQMSRLQDKCRDNRYALAKGLRNLGFRYQRGVLTRGTFNPVDRAL